MNVWESWMRSAAMVSDWSGAATEYAFALERPVAFVSTPQKIRNPDWRRIGLPGFEEAIRSEIGCIVAPTSRQHSRRLDQEPGVSTRDSGACARCSIPMHFQRWFEHRSRGPVPVVDCERWIAPRLALPLQPERTCSRKVGCGFLDAGHASDAGACSSRVRHDGVCGLRGSVRIST